MPPPRLVRRPPPAPPRRPPPGARRGEAILRRPPPRPPTSVYEAPFVWWAAHPWVVVWVAILMAPFVVLATRILDEQGYIVAENLLRWGGLGLFAVAVFLGLVVNGRGSAPRAAAGAVCATLAMILVVVFLYQSTLGPTACPPRAGKDLGSTVATRVVEAWKQGSAAGDIWQGSLADPSWGDRSRAYVLLDYERTDSGCWEHLAPVSARRTWHDFRVLLRMGATDSIAKSLRVHTVNSDGDWRVTRVEGPWP